VAEGYPAFQSSYSREQLVEHFLLTPATTPLSLIAEVVVDVAPGMFGLGSMIC
jgi:hypothetical protein